MVGSGPHGSTVFYRRETVMITIWTPQELRSMLPDLADVIPGGDMHNGRLVDPIYVVDDVYDNLIVDSYIRSFNAEWDCDTEIVGGYRYKFLAIHDGGGPLFLIPNHLL